MHNWEPKNTYSYISTKSIYNSRRLHYTFKSKLAHGGLLSKKYTLILLIQILANDLSQRIQIAFAQTQAALLEITDKKGLVKKVRFFLRFGSMKISSCAKFSSDKNFVRFYPSGWHHNGRLGFYGPCVYYRAAEETIHNGNICTYHVPVILCTLQ